MLSNKSVYFFLMFSIVISGCSMNNELKKESVVGWREIVAIPSLGVKEIKAKVDTGARTSSLHVTDLKVIKRGKTQFVEYIVHPKQDSSTPKIRNRTKVLAFRNVKSSNGITSKRPVVLVEVLFGQLKKEIEITLVNRDLMGFRMLIGRTALRPNFLVHSGKSFLLKNELKKKKIKKMDDKNLENKKSKKKVLKTKKMEK